MATHSKKDEESWVQHVLPLGASRSNCTSAASLMGDLLSYQGEPKMWKGSKRATEKRKEKWQMIWCCSALFARENHIPLKMRTTSTEIDNMCCFRDLWFNKCASPRIISESKQTLPHYISVTIPPTMCKFTIKTWACLWQGWSNMSSLFSWNCCCCSYCVLDFTFQIMRKTKILHTSKHHQYRCLSNHQQCIAMIESEWCQNQLSLITDKTILLNTTLVKSEWHVYSLKLKAVWTITSSSR